MLVLLRVRARNGAQMSLVMTPCQTSAHNASCMAEGSTDSPILSRIRWLICCANQGSSVSQNRDYRLLQRRTIRLIRFGGSERFCGIFL